MLKKIEKWMKRAVKERLYVLKEENTLYMIDGYMGYKLDLNQVGFNIIEKVLLRNREEVDILEIVEFQNIRDSERLEEVKRIIHTAFECNSEMVKLEPTQYINIGIHITRIFLKEKEDEEIKIHIKEDFMKFIDVCIYEFYQNLENDKGVIYAKNHESKNNGIEMVFLPIVEQEEDPVFDKLNSLQESR